MWSPILIQALKGKDLSIFGDGKQTRSFQNIDDLVEGMARMMGTKDDFTGPVNIGNQNEFTMLELAETILDLTKSSSKLIFMPLPQDDPKQRQPDISFAKKYLNGWKPKIQLKEGLEKTIKYYRTRNFPKKRIIFENIRDVNIKEF